MLTTLHIKNFKSWLDTGQVKIASLTGLFGTNSSGKTGIIQLLLKLIAMTEAAMKRTQGSLS